MAASKPTSPLSL